MRALRWIALGVGAVVAYTVVQSWPEIHRYMRIRAM
jgi:hypothetical protein